MSKTIRVPFLFQRKIIVQYSNGTLLLKNPWLYCLGVLRLVRVVLEDSEVKLARHRKLQKLQEAG